MEGEEWKGGGGPHDHRLEIAGDLRLLSNLYKSADSIPAPGEQS